ncbi:hypothetical protein [Streptomyces phaeoluteigriseus]|uniref:hypothetical protein n=1 Tax=Streptomyces phaeoluteigriseus TaxID=114686 RepID=UPI001FE63AFB|nr:hypothetical protein [Streptomyces phaeoluteigriseus]
MTPERAAPRARWRRSSCTPDACCWWAGGAAGAALGSGVPEPAESPQATAARVMYELTGYPTDGSSLPDRLGATVVCRLSAADAGSRTVRTPSARPTSTERPVRERAAHPERLRWAPFAGAIGAGG